MPRLSEPVRKRRVWFGFIVLFALINPWYFPDGVSTTLILGVPLWALIVLAASLALSLFITWTVTTQWRTDSDERFAAPVHDRQHDGER
ncbi:hypothetical protein C7446_0135 [Kushneria sinocarnis]|uniref:DUF3311 domain-containing protein n=1 Tax=Kushneria sinocarnis TaxID=595502 RepID=A0A420X0M6_9GAMM|nr:hypothetical protein [Kushneria sinocarnis]RKR07324.1 hypothetical protein C7446_0135 [Kushneria sinocarnis]